MSVREIYEAAYSLVRLVHHYGGLAWYAKWDLYDIDSDIKRKAARSLNMQRKANDLHGGESSYPIEHCQECGRMLSDQSGDDDVIARVAVTESGDVLCSRCARRADEEYERYDESDGYDFYWDAG